MRGSELKLCRGGAIQGKLAPGSEAEHQLAVAAGYNIDQVLTTDTLVSGEDVFFAATGITDGELLRGVSYNGTGATTYSMVMRSRSGTVRIIEARHHWDKLMQISQVAYDRR